MTSKTSDSDRLAAMEQPRKEFLRYLELFETAFDELHGAVMKQVHTPRAHIRPHHDYPVMSLLHTVAFHHSMRQGFIGRARRATTLEWFNLAVSARFWRETYFLRVRLRMHFSERSV